MQRMPSRPWVQGSSRPVLEGQFKQSAQQRRLYCAAVLLLSMICTSDKSRDAFGPGPVQGDRLFRVVWGGGRAYIAGGQVYYSDYSRSTTIQSVVRQSYSSSRRFRSIKS